MQTTPLFIYGKSLGGLITANFSIRFPHLFTGLTLVAPFFRHATDILEKYKWGYKFFNMIQFYTTFHTKTGSVETPDRQEFLAKHAYYYDDPKENSDCKLSTAVFFLDE